jgi:hypothetical protein
MTDFQKRNVENKRKHNKYAKNGLFGPLGTDRALETLCFQDFCGIT